MCSISCIDFYCALLYLVHIFYFEYGFALPCRIAINASVEGFENFNLF